MVRRAVVSTGCDDGHLRHRVYAATRSSHACVPRVRVQVQTARLRRDLLTRQDSERAGQLQRVDVILIITIRSQTVIPRGPGCQSVLRRSTSADGAKRSAGSDKARAAAGCAAHAPRRSRGGKVSVCGSRSRRVASLVAVVAVVNGVRVIDYSNNPPPLAGEWWGEWAKHRLDNITLCVQRRAWAG